MLALRVVQAAFGDCLIVEFGTPEHRRHVLVDGGPPGTYTKHLEPVLIDIAAAGGRLDLTVLSHVDNDHVAGLLDLMTQLRERRVNEQPETIAVDGLWHNSFARTIDANGNLLPRLNAMVESAGGPQVMALAGTAIAGIREGDQLRLGALDLQIPINMGFSDDLICVDTAPDPTRLGDLTARIVGPTRANLEELEREWREWLAEHEDGVATGEPVVAAMADNSVPNLSSIVVLVEAEGRRMLLTGDGRGDHVLDGLQRAGLLNAEGSIEIDVLKVPHHGSDRNATREFFRSVKANVYVISANGLYGNPDLATLIWIVEAAQEQGRKIGIVATNPTLAIDKLVQEYPQAEYGYCLTVMPAGDDSIVVDAAPAVSGGSPPD